MSKRILKSCIWIIISIFSCSGPDKEGTGLQIFRYNEANGISGLDPAFARTKSLIWPVNQIFNGLVQMDDDLNILPCIAKSWEISEDGKLYSFCLRNDVFFHNNPCFPGGKGRSVNASDFVFSFERILDPDLMSPGRWVFNYVEEGGITALNDSILQINLKRPFSPFLGILSMPYCFVVPYEAILEPDNDFAREPVGTGPFSFLSWREEEILLLSRNEKYFETDSMGNNLPYLEGVSISFIKDKQSEFMEFLLGNIDMLSGIHPAYKDEMLTRSGTLNPMYNGRFQLITEDYLNTEYLAFLVDSSQQSSGDNPLIDINLRKAINFGFDRVKMMKYLRNSIGEPAVNGFIPGGMKNYNHEQIKGYYFNPDTVSYFLEKAGFPGGEGIPELTLTTTSEYLDLCEFIQYELQRFGIELKIDIATAVTFRNKVQNSNLNFFRASWIADYPDPESYLSLFYSENYSPAGPNYTHFSDPVYDSMYLSSITTADFSERIELYKKMDSMIIEESVVVPLFYDEVLRIIPVGLEGMGSNPMNLLKLKYARKGLVD